MKFNETEFLPVILGADITAYSHARSFHQEYGIKSLVLSMLKSEFIARSSIIENRVIEGLEKEEVLIDTLIKVGKEFEGKKKLIVLGCGDWYVRILIENKEVLKPYYIIPYIDESLLNRIVLKDKFYAICEELGIPYPKTYVYNCRQENDLKFDFPYPVIAKPANSALYHYAKFEGKKKVFRFQDEQSLRTMLDRLEQTSYDYKFLIQDYIPGADTNMRVLTCYSDRNGKVRFAALGHVLLEDHTPSAIGNHVVIINERNDEIVRQATKFLEHVGYTGFSNFDIKYDPRDNTYRFFEINVRLGRSNFYVTGSGYNTVKWIVDDLVYGKELDYTIADNEHLYTVVPKGVIKKYVADKEQRERALRLFKENKVSYPLIYPVDRNPVRDFYVYAALYNQYRKFNMYF
ncbi:MAG: hypothetical protein GX264_04580 [Clostridiales bacterium]|nr:hypothetical protein [Clostridiales bacterium]